MFKLILSRYGNDIQKICRHLERLHKQIGQARSHVVFLKRCRDNQLIPNGLTIKTEITSLKVSRLTREIEAKKVKDHIKNWKL